jgi:maltooligosyltrehalose trehalohydrolase
MDADTWRQFYRDLLAIRATHIAPRLTGSHALSTKVLSPRAIQACWTMGDGHRLTIAFNLGDASVALPDSMGMSLFALNIPVKAGQTTELPGISFIACLHAANQ